MSREVRRVPLDWQHPMEWREQWDASRGRVRMQLLPRPLLNDSGYHFTYWEKEGEELARREGWQWKFWSEYCLTGYQGREDTEPTIHPFDVSKGVQVKVRDEDHLHELLLAKHETERPNPADFMPQFPEGTAVGWCMYETTSEGTPISPVFETPEELARWLADNKASAFGYSTATYEEWMRAIDAGWTPSAVEVNGVLKSGVEVS